VENLKLTQNCSRYGVNERFGLRRLSYVILSCPGRKNRTGRAYDETRNATEINGDVYPKSHRSGTTFRIFVYLTHPCQCHDFTLLFMVHMMTGSTSSPTLQAESPPNGQAIGSGLPLEPGPPPLLMNPNRSKTLFRVGCVVAILDLSVMPIVYFYSLRYRTNLSLQDSTSHSSRSS
jgi:hypothetical protein